MSRADGILFALFFSVFMALRPPGLPAQEVRGVSVNCTVPVVQQLRLSRGSVILPSPGVEDFTNGFIQADRALTLTVSTNTAWELTVQTSNSDLGAVGVRRKPLSDFLLRADGATFVPISNAPVLVDSHAAYSAGKDIEMDCRILLDWALDKSGTLEVGLTFTLISSN